MEYTTTSTDDIYLVLKKFIYSATGYATYKERSDFTKPKGNFATVHIMSYQNTGNNRGDEGYYDSDGALIRSKNFNVQVTVRLYGDGSFNKMLELEHYFASSTEYDDLPYYETALIALLKMQMVTDVSVPIGNSNWEERSQCLLTFNTSFTWTEDVGELSSVTITTSVAGDGDTITGSDEIDSDGTTVINDDSDGGTSDGI